MNHQTIADTAGGPLSSAAPGRSTIKLFLADGTPQGLIIAEIINWTGQALAAPRSSAARLLQRSEAKRTGIYILMGPDPDRPSGAKAYIGEADNVADRLRNHLRTEEKEFFERLVIVVAKDDNLTKAHARFLESQLIRAAREAGSVSLANATRPDFHILPEADRADMEFFVSQLRLMLPILGFDLFRRSAANSEPDVSGEEPLFIFEPTGASATARETEDGFVVRAGSTARKHGTATFPAGYRALRDRLVQDGHLVEGAQPDLYRFAADVAFASPSAAASIVAARSASGPGEWKLIGTDLVYRDWLAQRLAGG
jgi:hypothetical protein